MILIIKIKCYLIINIHICREEPEEREEREEKEKREEKEEKKKEEKAKKEESPLKVLYVQKVLSIYINLSNIFEVCHERFKGRVCQI